MARPKIRKAPRRRPAAKRASLPASVATAVIDRLFTMTGSGRDDVIATARGTRKPGALSHPAARGKAAGRQPSLAAAVASAVTGRLSASAPARTGPARTGPARAGKPRASLAAAVASAVSRQLAGRAATRRR